MLVNNALEAIRLMEQRRKNGEYISNWDLGRAYFVAGMPTKASEYLDKAIKDRDPHYVPFLKSSDPRLEEFENKLRAVLKF